MNTSTQSIAHIRSTIGFYGAEQVIYNVLPWLNKSRHTHLITLEGDTAGSGLLAEKIAALQIPVMALKTHSRLDWPSIRAMRRYFKQNAIKLVHTHDYKSLIHATLACVGLPIKRIHQQHGALGNTKAEQMYARIELFFMRFVDHIVVVSEAQKRPFEKARWSYPKATLVLNGTPEFALEERRAASEKFNLIMVARLSEEKNHLMALQIVAELKRTGIPVMLHIVGDGPLRSSLEQTTIQFDISDCVCFHGFHSTPLDLIKRADIALITSRTEGLPMALLESLSCGVPVVSTAVGQIPVVLSETECGVTLNGDVATFVATLSSLYQNPSVYRQWGINGRQLVAQRYSVRQQAAAFENLYAT